MPEFTREDRQYEKLFQILYTADPRVTVYVYRLIDGKRVAPYLFKTQPFYELETYIAREFGDGRYYLLIRRRGKMIFSGEIGLLMKLKPTENQTPGADSHTIPISDSHAAIISLYLEMQRMHMLTAMMCALVRS